MSQNLVKFKALTKSQFEDLSQKDSNRLYFITDTRQIFKGSVEYCAAGIANGVLIIKGALTSDQSGVIARPSGFKKGYIYILPAGTFEESPVEAGDLAIALYDHDYTIEPSTTQQDEPQRTVPDKYFTVIKSATNIEEAAEWEE